MGLVLYKSGRTLSHEYFPTTAIVSLLFVFEDSAKIAVVESEGIVGISLFMGGTSTPSRAVGQSAGRGYRLSSRAIRGIQLQGSRDAPDASVYPSPHNADGADGSLQSPSHARHATLLLLLLLLSMDRLKGNDLMRTQESIVNMLGVRREGVTAVALKLLAAGLNGRIAGLPPGAVSAPGLRSARVRCCNAQTVELLTITLSAHALPKGWLHPLGSCLEQMPCHDRRG